ncbi:hypothetical protein MPSEU_000326600 [Mayamaea pseudoterrestris]|nr:hypothetical protein MPSEU_000326600 [Mayamaea pseudoterrestris]
MSPPPPSAWSKRTAKRRQQMEQLLSSIKLPSILGYDKTTESLHDLQVPVLHAPAIPWNSFPLLDPEQGGRLQKDSPRGRRKRIQVEAFCYIVDKLMMHPKDESVIVDAGSGAGNLTIGMAGWLQWQGVLAIDVNETALQQLASRASQITNCRIQTLTADLNDSNIQLPTQASVVCSLHACGAATDMGLQLATRHQLPFVASPCCTAKSMALRRSVGYGPSASFQRSGAPIDMVYPRSQWLRLELFKYLNASSASDVENDQSSISSESLFNTYSKLAKVADVGLGPQTPLEQVRHQRLAKLVVELDRLAGVVEQHSNYQVKLVRLCNHADYGKAEILIGVPSDNHLAVKGLNELALLHGGA